MKKVLISLLPVFFALFLTPTSVASSNLEVSANSDFSNQTLNFNAGQTVYVRLSAQSSGAKTHTLNLRDNQYNLLNSYDLSISGNQFTASFSAPSNEGYYSLEAKVESEGSLTTAVKTIKIGSPQNANVNVSIRSNVPGQKVLGTDSSSASTEPTSKASDNNGVAYQSSTVPTSDVKDNQDIEFQQNNQDSQNKTFTYKIKVIFIKIISVIWPF